MSYKKYKLILLFLVFLYFFIGFSVRYIGSETLSIKIMIYFLIIAISYHLLLFVFILNAKSRGVENCNKKFSPSRLLPIVTLFICISAIGYTLSMFAIYGTLRSLEDKYLNKPLEESLGKIRIASVNENISADKRERLASFYYKHTGESIYYLDENNKRQMYTPEKSAKKERKDYVQITNKKENFLKFLIFSAIISLSFAIIISAVYFHIRKKDLLEQKTLSLQTH
jgi:hypothetical protein